MARALVVDRSAITSDRSRYLDGDWIFFILISVLVIVLQFRFIGKKTGIVLDDTRHGIQ